MTNTEKVTENLQEVIGQEAKMEKVKYYKETFEKLNEEKDEEKVNNLMDEIKQDLKENYGFAYEYNDNNDEDGLLRQIDDYYEYDEDDEDDMLRKEYLTDNEIDYYEYIQFYHPNLKQSELCDYVISAYETVTVGGNAFIDKVYVEFDANNTVMYDERNIDSLQHDIDKYIEKHKEDKE